MNPLACVRYAIGAKTTIVNIPERVTMYGYNAIEAPSAKYVNLFSEHDEVSEYAPYLPKTDTAKQYGEGVPDPAGPGFWRNLDDQIDRAIGGKAKAVETDNRDAYRNAVTLKVFDRVAARGLRVICKNPGMSDHGEDSTELLKPPVVASAIIEEGDVTPGEFHRMRVAAGRPELPCTFVSFGSGRSWALDCATEIAVHGYVNMGVTYDRSPNEYGGDDEIVLVPISPTQRPSMAVPPASNRIWRGDGVRSVAKSLLMLYDQVDSMLPASRKHGNDGSVGDLSHQATKSDHNPNDSGIVTAIDITHDPASGFDADAFAESLRRLRDSRLKYVIWRGRIFGDEGYAQRNGATAYEWAERNKGPGDHSEHVHVSVDADSADDLRLWVFDLVNAGSPMHSAPSRPKLKIGDSGPAVVELQLLLGVEADSFFGSATEAAVQAFQARRGLFVDGIVGSHTWGLLTSVSGAAPSVGAASLAPDTIARITALAASSAIARYSWADRGVAPIGYIKGMAVTFAKVYLDLKVGGSAARVMAALPTGDSERDALAWYGVSNVTAGASTLRALFTLLIGLGMRESSGKYYEGRDASATNTSGDTAEAGLFQQSWDSRGASAELPKLFARYSANPNPTFLAIFSEGVGVHDTTEAGGGEGAEFQGLCKRCPTFAVECAAVGLRTIRRHWGPINRREVEVRPEADALLQQVQAVVDAIPVTKPIDGDVLPPLPQPPLPAVSNPLTLIVLLLIILKGKTMANESGTQPDLDKLIQALLGALGGKPITPPPPPPPPPPVAPDINALIAALLASLQGGKPILLPAPTVIDQSPAPVKPPVKDATATPIMQKPSVRIGIIGGLISAAATYFSGGLIPPGIGEMVTAAFGITAGAGSTSIFGSIKNMMDRRMAARYAAAPPA